MANTPKKIDQTDEDMMSAIEDALALNEQKPEADPAPSAETTSLPATPVPPSPSSPDEANLVPPVRNTLAPQRAANDDRQSVGQILASLHRKPSFTPFIVAATISAVWTLGIILYARGRYHDELNAIKSITQLFDQPFFVPLAAMIIVPVIGFFVFAALIRRSQEMRFAAGAMTEITMRLAEPEKVTSEAFVSVGQAIRREVASLSDGVERAIARAAELESLVRSEVSTLEHAYEENEMRVRQLIDSLQSERDGIMTHALRLHETIAGVHQSYNFDVGGFSDRVNNSITETTNRVIENFVNETQNARAQINTAGDEVTRNLLDRSHETSQNLARIGEAIATAVAARGIKTIEQMQEKTEIMSASIVSKGEAIKNALISRLEQLEDSIVLRGGEVADRVMSDTTALSSQISMGLASFENTVKVQGTNIVEQISNSAEKVNQTTAQNVASLDSRLLNKTQELSDALDQRISRIEKTLAERTASLNDTLATRTLEFARTIADGAKSTHDAVDKSVAGLGEYFSTKAQEIAETISERTDKINQVLGNRALEMTQSLDTRVTRFEEMVAGRLEGVSNSIERKSIAAADALAAKIESTSLGLRNEAAEVQKTFTKLADDVSLTLVERTRDITSVHETLQSNVTGVLARLNDANTQLKAVLAGVVENLGPIEGAVGDKVTGFQKALETTLASTGGAIAHMDTQLRDLREVSSKVITDVSSLTNRFEDQGRFLATAVDNLGETHRRIDTTLTERREAIEALTSHLSTRSSDLEERLARFNKLLSEQLTAAEEKAQDIAKLVADSTANSTQAIIKQYDLVKNTSAEERERTAAALRATYENANSEVNMLFRDMNQRFTDAARELREVANEVQHSLDQTRQELKRGVFELPHETRESTAAMRRLVADQIKALAELNEIVNRYSRNIDHTSPRRMEVVEEAMLSSTPTPRRELSSSIVDRAPSRLLPREEVRSRTEPPLSSRRSEERSSDLISDLLTRAKRDEEELRDERPVRHETNRTREELRDREKNRDTAHREVPSRNADAPMRAIDSLDALSNDIARLVDHDAAIELWDRHKRGEKNVFTRRLYTAQGQKTFEDIRRKYRRSTEFRETVDHYIEEFERLLDQVSRDDRGQVLTKTYLTSDTGKVYTLLAHAAGKFV
jgi:hypothetical protein